MATEKKLNKVTMWLNSLVAHHWLLHLLLGMWGYDQYELVLCIFCFWISRSKMTVFCPVSAVSCIYWNEIVVWGFKKFQIKILLSRCRDGKSFALISLFFFVKFWDVQDSQVL